MKEPVKVLMAAINGYGAHYLKTFLEETDCQDAVLVGIVDPEAEKSKYYNAFREFGIPISSRMNDFYLGRGKADLAVIASPPHFHVSQGMMALHHGTNVLCEKPVSGLLGEAESLAEKSRKTGRFVMVGFQWSYSEGIQKLKSDILSGRFGKPLRMKSLCLWPRNFAYFSRNSWAYRKTDSAGNTVMDNLFNNAMAHFIHNIFFLLGGTMTTSASFTKPDVRIGRAYDVETYDTGAFMAYTESGTELLFLGSHVAEKSIDPCFRIEFEKGFVELKSGAGTIMAKTTGREEFSYPSPDSDHQFRKLFRAIENVSEPGNEICPVEATLPHARLVDAVEKSAAAPYIFPGKDIIRNSDRLFVKGLDDLLLKCYRDFTLPGKSFSG
jgi:predicted dehydrogenase